MAIRERTPWGARRPPAGSQIRTAHPMASGLVGCYFLGDPTGQIFNLANPSQGLTKVSAPTNYVGLFGPAMLFKSASNQYLESTTLPVSVFPFTFVCWFSVDTAARYNLVTLTDNTSGNYNSLEVSTINDSTVTAGAVCAASWDGTTGADAATTTRFAANTWTQGVAAFTATNSRRVWLNGAGGTSNATTSNTSGYTRFDIGALNGSSLFHATNGLIDHVLVYNRTLTDSDVRALYLSPFDFFESPKAMWLVESKPSGNIKTNFMLQPLTQL